MTTRNKLVWLTIFQAAMIVVGIGVLVLIKTSYQRLVIVKSFREALAQEVMGKKSFHPTSPAVILPWLGLPLALIAGRNVASLFYRAGRKKRQIKRDLRADLLVAKLGRGANEPYCLYLRSFSAETKLRRKKDIWWFIFLEGDIFGIDRETLDLLISAELRRSYPVVALGRPGDRLGAGKLPSTDADWQDLIVLLMSRASLILMTPSTSVGVLWEASHVRAHHSAKTIYVMPPPSYYRKFAPEVERHWQETQSSLRSQGVFLPSYDPKGAFFTLGLDGRPGNTVPFGSVFGGTNLRDLIAQLGYARR